MRLFIAMPSTQQYDKQLGYSNIPGSLMIESQEGYSHILYNKLGFNDDDPDASLKHKVFIIGDSYTEAIQLDKSLSYPSLLESALKNDSYDIIKIARDSYVPFHYPILSNRLYNEYNPEFTIVQFGSHSVSDLYGDNIKVQYDDLGNIKH
ncbi:MAG: hypothetical protein QM500_02620, partial [Methylococcales bacterium]